MEIYCYVHFVDQLKFKVHRKLQQSNRSSVKLDWPCEAFAVDVWWLVKSAKFIQACDLYREWNYDFWLGAKYRREDLRAAAVNFFLFDFCWKNIYVVALKFNDRCFETQMLFYLLEYLCNVTNPLNPRTKTSLSIKTDLRVNVSPRIHHHSNN